MAVDEGEVRWRQPGLVPLPRVDDLPRAAKGGIEPEAVESAFRGLELYTASLRSQLRELQERRDPAETLAREPRREPVAGGRAEAAELVRAAAEFAETLERDGREAAERLLREAEALVTGSVAALESRAAELELLGEALEARRSTIVEDARREAEAVAARTLEAARADAAEIVRAAQADVERRLEWTRAQCDAMLRRARSGATELRPAAGGAG